jgi:photosystem II stability/assembly factor-like uncharacterized protein
MACFGRMNHSAIRRIARNLGMVFMLAMGLVPSFAAQWNTLGPEGGDVRSLSYDPTNPDHVFLGTSSGEVFVSHDGGRNWARLAHLGDRDDYVLDHIVVDPQSSKTIYVSAWSFQERQAGDIFRSKDGGKSWESFSAMHNKSVRALALGSDSKTLVAGTLDGVYRSGDRGKSWEKVSPPNHPEVKNIEAIALDPSNPNVIYAGTSHLAWKTRDGGLNWEYLKKGLSESSDVPTILVDRNNSLVVFAAGSGIYKSENMGESFNKVQSASFPARRTRVLRQDPRSGQIVYAGTSDGLWKSADLGKNWKRMTGSDIVVNDVLVNPRNPQNVLMATDSMGVLASSDGAKSFSASNQGYTHRYIGAIRADHTNPQVIYIGVVNDHESGGVFISRDGGIHWQQNSSGLHGYDVFALDQASNGDWLAGTTHGMFLLQKTSSVWRPSNSTVSERGTPRLINVNGRERRVMSHTAARGTLQGQVNDVKIAPNRWLAATSAGLFSSSDQGKLWSGGPVLGKQDFISVNVEKEFVVAATRSSLLVSADGGTVWRETSLRSLVSSIYAVTLVPNFQIYVAGKEGAFHSADSGASWEHLTNGIPQKEIGSITFDATNNRLLATSNGSGAVFESTDKGRSWRQYGDAGYRVRAIGVVQGRVLGATPYDGLIAEPGYQSALTVGTASK